MKDASKIEFDRREIAFAPRVEMNSLYSFPLVYGTLRITNAAPPLAINGHTPAFAQQKRREERYERFEPAMGRRYAARTENIDVLSWGSTLYVFVRPFRRR